MENRILIDTNIIIDFLKGKGSGVEIFKLIVTKYEPCTSYINKFELLCGVRSARELHSIEDCLSGFTIFHFDNTAVSEASKIYIHLKKQGTLIGIRDIMIAGVAVSKMISIATRNLDEFSRVPGLSLFR